MNDMTKPQHGEKCVTFVLDGREVHAHEGETIWQVAQREGVEIPHLCYSPEPGYRADGNCRACMVEIEGERVLAASCIRKPTPGMKVKTASERAKASRKMVFELLMADQPERDVAHDPDSRFWKWSERVGVEDIGHDAGQVGLTSGSGRRPLSGRPGPSTSTRGPGVNPRRAPRCGPRRWVIVSSARAKSPASTGPPCAKPPHRAVPAVCARAASRWCSAPGTPTPAG